MSLSISPLKNYRTLNFLSCRNDVIYWKKIFFFDTDIEGRKTVKRRIFWIWQKNLKLMTFYGHITDYRHSAKKNYTFVQIIRENISKSLKSVLTEVPPINTLVVMDVFKTTLSVFSRLQSPVESIFKKKNVIYGGFQKHFPNFFH